MYSTIALVMVCLGASFLFLSIVLMFSLHILDALDEITGRKAKRQVKRLKELNVSTNVLDAASTEDIYKVVSSGSIVNDFEGMEDLEVKPENIEIVKYESNDKDSVEATSFMDECATSYIDSSVVSEMISEVKNYTETRRSVEVIQEQSSIL